MAAHSHRPLTFIVPVRHPVTMRNPAAHKEALRQTLSSLSNQTDDSWRAVVVANKGTDLPPLPRGVELATVEYPPNPMHELGDHDFKAAMDAVRLDKGRRIWAGMRTFPETEYVMLVDDDDFISCRLTAFVAANLGPSGWYVDRGYALSQGSALTIELLQFHKICGTSHITRFDLYTLPEEGDPDFAAYVSKWLGSHGATTEHFEEIGAPLAPLPFHGAAYLVANPNSHSISNRLIRQYVLNKDTLRHPLSLFGKLSRLKRIDSAFRAEFFGDGPP